MASLRKRLARRLARKVAAILRPLVRQQPVVDPFGRFVPVRPGEVRRRQG